MLTARSPTPLPEVGYSFRLVIKFPPSDLMLVGGFPQVLYHLQIAERDANGLTNTYAGR